MIFSSGQPAWLLPILREFNKEFSHFLTLKKSHTDRKSTCTYFIFALDLFPDRMSMKSVRDISLNINSSDGDVSVAESVPTQMVSFLFLLFDVPSVRCIFMVLFYFARLRELCRQYPANQIIIYLVIGSFMITVIYVPLILPYLHNYQYIRSFKDPHSF